MTDRDAQHPLERARSGSPAEGVWKAGPWPEATEVPPPVLYDEIDRRLMDTFPASDAVARY